MRQRTKPLTEPAAPPGWSVRRTSLADRFAGVTASLLLGSTAIAGSLAAGGYLAQDHFAANDRARAVADILTRTPARERGPALEVITRLYPGAQYAVLDANGATLVRGGSDVSYPRPDVALQAVAQARLQTSAVLDLEYNAPDHVRRIAISNQPGAPFVIVARAPSEHGGALAAALLAAILAAGGGAASLGFFAARKHYRRALAPLKDISRAAHNVSPGKFEYDLDVQSGDELEATALAFKRMVRRVDADVTRQLKAVPLDPVTGLLNRAAFVKRAGALVRPGAGMKPGALILCNLVRFRHVNETVGQAGADAALHAIARTFDALTRTAQMAGGVLARLGADEFALVAPGIADAQGAQRLMQEMIAAASAPLAFDGHEFRLTASAGAVIFDGGEHDIERLIGHAQAALKRGRTERPGIGRIYTASLDKRAGDVIAVETAIRDAIARDRFVPYFQPKVDLTTGRITSVEALARWEVPGRGVIEPAKFITHAENLGLIKEIGEVILRKACMAAAEWRKHGLRIRVAVNVAPAQFDDPAFSAKVFRIIRETGIAPDMLELEITESAAMKNPAAALRQITPLRKAGVRLSLDDFGTGHSSLASLTQMPFDVFKIDRQFVSGIGEDEQAEAVVDTILGLARTLNFEVVAEGIENVRQEAFLRKRGCTLGQGYLYGKPMALPQFLDMAHGASPRALRAVS